MIGTYIEREGKGNKMEKRFWTLKDGTIVAQYQEGPFGREVKFTFISGRWIINEFDIWGNLTITYMN